MAKMDNSWVTRQLERLAETRPDLIEAIVQHAMLQDAEFRGAVVVGAYLDGQINLAERSEGCL